MLAYTKMVDSNGKVYLPKELRSAGYGESVELIPEYRALVLFPSGTSLRLVKKSLEILLLRIDHRLSAEKAGNISEGVKERE